ncbi:hypothetical protein HIM_09936 [Hirsutella minnesotensis 3608]|uniref:F-box domain-containing protein n=1 Tax=Hirsutella minnesotensis 3608 TaxID=1043627 RepID=A0A0F7ZS33_9HYPO|nr:hypothetical protein HIM_09936 [Hirsutella minnesotensis 3608]
MPPIRTARKNSSSTRKPQQLGMTNAPRAPVTKPPKPASHPNPAEAPPSPAEAVVTSNALLTSIGVFGLASIPAASRPTEHIGTSDATRSVSKGEKEAHFRSDKEWEEQWQYKLGNRTKKLSFGDAFVLTDQHVEQLISLGSSICASLTHFEFLLSDVSYTAHNENKLTEAATTQLARMCPSLRVVKLQGAHASRLTDATLVGFLSNCPNLTSVEVSGLEAAGTIKEVSFDALREHPAWAPKLKTLRIPNCGYRTQKDEASWMKAMRALSRERDTLLIEVASVSQVKKWGDWELETFVDKYRKGKVQRPW